MFELPNEIKHLARNNDGSKQLANPNEVKHPFRVSCRLVFPCRTSHSGLFPTTTRVWCSSWRLSEVHTCSKAASYFTGAKKAAIKTQGESIQSLFSSLSKRERDISQLDVTLPRPRCHRDHIMIGHQLAKKGRATRINLNSWEESRFDSEAEASGPLRPLIFSHRSKYSASSDKNNLVTHPLRCPWLVSVTLLGSLLVRCQAVQR